MADASDYTSETPIYWQCTDCQAKFWKSKSGCTECGGGPVVTKHEGRENLNLSGFFQRLTIPQYLALVLSLAALFIIVFFATIYVGA